MSKKLFVSFAVFAVLILALAACTGGAADCPEPEPVDCPQCETCPDAPADAGPMDEGVAQAYYDAWVNSGHNNVEAEAFRHWDEEDPVAVPGSCAKCHSSYGFQDFVGADGTAFGSVEAENVPIDSTIDCNACHNAGTANLTSVVMPSGVEITGLGDSARCMQCHQGRESGVSVDAHIEAVGLTDNPDGTSPEGADPALGFRNIHYFAAAASLFGGETVGGYQYAGKAYQGRNTHAGGLNECIDCHNPHTLEVKIDVCAGCHGDGELQDYRMNGSLMDYDGDGNIEEGVYYEIETLAEALYAEIQTYAEANGGAITYDSQAYPYWFDSAGERYAAWTPRLLKAAYNYQVAMKDPGAFAHNSKYIISLLYDSIEDLGGDVSAYARNDAGHFDGTAEAFRHWDEEGAVPGTCSKCHAGEGLAQFITEGANISNPPGNGFACVNCHDPALGAYSGETLYAVTKVTFPSGKVATFSTEKDDKGNYTDPNGSNLCITCHQGRESKAGVDRVIASGNITFRNIHYFPAGATLFGTDVQGGYEFDGKTYVGRFMHVDGYAECSNCHDVHALEVKLDECSSCHTGISDPRDIRKNSGDFDGDGAEEGVYGEIETLQEALYAAMQAYTAGKGLSPIVYDAHSYPYFFNDTNGNGAADPDEAVRENGYNNFDANLLKAAYNYQYSMKDPGAFAHNAPYMVQLLIDSIEAVGGNVGGYIRP